MILGRGFCGHFRSFSRKVVRAIRCCVNLLLNAIGLGLYRYRAGYHYVPDIYGRSSFKMNDIRSDGVFFPMADRVIRDQTTFLYYDRLYTIYQVIRNIVTRSDPKKTLTFMEIGVFKGGGSHFVAELSQEIADGRVQLFCVDTFEGHSACDLPDGKDGDHSAGLFGETDYDDVCRYLSRFEFVTVLRGRIQDQASRLDRMEFDFIHLDVDIYNPTKFTLDHFGGRMNPGGVIVVDDYGFTTCPGVTKAVDEFIKANSGFYRFNLLTGQSVLIKLDNPKRKKAH